MKLFRGLLPMSYLEKGDICSFFSNARKSQISPKSLQYNECPSKHPQKHNELGRSVCIHLQWVMDPAVTEADSGEDEASMGAITAWLSFSVFCGIVFLLAEMVVTGLLR